MEINYVGKIDFEYQPYSEDIVIIGKKKSGKSERLKRILESIASGIPFWIWDYSNRFNGYGHLVHSIDELGYGQYIVQEKDKSEKRFREFCKKAFDGAQSGELSNLVFGVDELHQYLRKQSILQELYEIVMSGRNFGLSGIYLSTRPQAIPNWILENITHVFAYKQNLEGTISWMKTYIGEEAWLLLPKDKRKFLKEEPELPDFSFIYRNQNHDRPQVCVK